MSSLFTRTEMLIGKSRLEKLTLSRVAVFGLGGVGSYAAEALARAGVGSLYLVDHDTVALSNINRQLHALYDTVGRSKTGVMEERLRSINPNIIVETRQEKFSPGVASSMLDHNLDFVVDAIDDVENKVALLVECARRRIRIVSAMGAGNNLDPTKFRIDSIWNTSVCPLARVVRKKLRIAGINEDIPVVYSVAKPVSHEFSPVPGERAVPGSISYVPPVAGFFLAGYVVDKLLDLGVFSDR